MKTQLQQLAKAINNEVCKMYGNSGAFDVECGNLVAFGRYEAEIGFDKGDRWTAPSEWVENERVIVEALFDEWGDEIENAEYIAYLNNMLN